MKTYFEKTISEDRIWSNLDSIILTVPTSEYWSGWSCISSGRPVRPRALSFKRRRPDPCFLSSSYFDALEVSAVCTKNSTIMSKPQVFFDMTVGGKSVGRIVMEVCTNLFKFEAVCGNLCSRFEDLYLRLNLCFFYFVIVEGRCCAENCRFEPSS